VVYCPHLYPRDAAASSVEEWRTLLLPNFRAMRAEADSWGGALVLGEWGIHPNDRSAPEYIQAVQSLSIEYGSGQAFWVWKENSQGSWGFFDFDEAAGSWLPREQGLKQIGRPHALAVPGRFLHHSFDPESRELRVGFRSEGDDGPPLLYLPDIWYPSGFEVILNGLPAAAGEFDRQTHRILIDWSPVRGNFDLLVRPKGPSY
jgi:hypothetical protein